MRLRKRTILSAGIARAAGTALEVLQLLVLVLVQEFLQLGLGFFLELGDLFPLLGRQAQAILKRGWKDLTDPRRRAIGASSLPLGESPFLVLGQNFLYPGKQSLVQLGHRLLVGPHQFPHLLPILVLFGLLDGIIQLLLRCLVLLAQLLRELRDFFFLLGRQVQLPENSGQVEPGPSAIPAAGFAQSPPLLLGQHLGKLLAERLMNGPDFFAKDFLGFARSPAVLVLSGLLKAFS